MLISGGSSLRRSGRRAGHGIPGLRARTDSASPATVRARRGRRPLDRRRKLHRSRIAPLWLPPASPADRRLQLPRRRRHTPRRSYWPRSTSPAPRSKCLWLGVKYMPVLSRVLCAQGVAAISKAFRLRRPARGISSMAFVSVSVNSGSRTTSGLRTRTYSDILDSIKRLCAAQKPMFSLESSVKSSRLRYGAIASIVRSTEALSHTRTTKSLKVCDARPSRQRSMYAAEL